jgi:hypothetical protein
MKSKSVLGTGLALLFLLTLKASAGSVPLNTISYNFQLGTDGGGASATLNGVPVEIYCDDFADDVWVPYNYSANVTTLGTAANLSSTRFGGVASNAWTTISLDDTNTTLDTQDDAFFNSGSGSSSLARYEMVAYLVSLYNRSLGNNTSNDQIQESIWNLMDPKAEGASTKLGVDDTSYLEQAASWYNTMNKPANLGALNSFLAQFQVVDPTNMTYSSGLGYGGFQEQIVMTVTPAPEPRGSVLLLLGLLVGGFFLMRHRNGALLTVDAR